MRKVEVEEEVEEEEWRRKVELEVDVWRSRRYLLVGPTRYSGPVSRTLEILITPPY